MSELVDGLVHWSIATITSDQPDQAELAERLRVNKLLLTIISDDAYAIESDPLVRQACDRDEGRIAALKKIASELMACQEGDLRIIKGSRYALRYGSRLRYQADLDMLACTEAAFIAAGRALRQRGFVQRSGHALFLAGRAFASAIFYEPDENGLPWVGGLFVELHLHGFPISPLSYLDMTNNEFDALPPVVQDITTLLAEFAYRDGRTKKFLLRDVFDTVLLFSELSRNDFGLLLSAVESNQLWSCVGLLKIFIEGLTDLNVPPLLTELMQHVNAPVPAEEYSLFENQAWPFLAARGLTREGYERLHESYSRLTDASWRKHFSEFEIGIEYARGVPIAINFRDDGDYHDLLSGCNFLAGPKSERQIINKRIDA